MSQFLYEDEKFRIIRTKKDYILIRKDLHYRNHAHFAKLQGAKFVIEMYYKKLIPYKRYFKGSVKRITTEEEYDTFRNQQPKEKYRNGR